MEVIAALRSEASGNVVAEEVLDTSGERSVGPGARAGVRPSEVFERMCDDGVESPWSPGIPEDGNGVRNDLVVPLVEHLSSGRYVADLDRLTNKVRGVLKT